MTINTQTYAQAMETGKAKLAASQAHFAKLVDARKTVASLAPQLEKAQAKVDALKAQLEKAPARQRPALEKQLKDAQGALRTVKDQVIDAEVAVTRLQNRSGVVQSEAFAAQRSANTMARELGSSVLPFPLVDGFESMGELATMDPKKYAEAIGGEPSTSALKRGAGELVTAVKYAANTPKGAQVLADKLRNADPTAQKAILEGAHAELELIAARVVRGPGREALRGYADAVKALDPSLRPVLIKALAAKLEVSPSELYESQRSGNGGKSGFTTELRAALKEGKGAELVGPLLKELKGLGKTDEAKALAGNVAKAMGELRADFKKKHDVVMDSQADLARLVYGFRGSMTGPQLEKAIATFKERHSSELGPLDASVRNSLNLVRELDALPDDDPALKAAKDELKGDVPKLLETRAGAEELKTQIKAQVLGNKSWLEKVGDWSTDSKTVLGAKGELSKMVIKAAAGLSISGGAVQKIDMGKFLVANQRLLGLNQKSATALASAMKSFDPTVAASHLAFDDALKAAAPRDPKLLKGLGVVLSLPGAIAGWKGFDDKALNEKMQAVLGTGSAAVSSAEFLIEAFNKADSLKGLGGGLAVAGKVLGAATALLDGVGAVKSFAEGNVGDGVAGSMSAVGGLLMLGGPAGMAAGAALTLGGFVVKKVWGSDPAAEAEAADEADAQAFLQAGGFPDNVADAFSDLLRSDRRNLGTFISQVAKELSISPDALVKHLGTLSKDKLEQLVREVKDMRVDANWHYPQKRTDAMTTGDGSRQSIESTVEWMKFRGMVPPRAT